MGMFYRKAAAPDIYTFAGVAQDNPLAARIQHHVDLLRYVADHSHLTRHDLAGYMDMTERYGMGDRLPTTSFSRPTGPRNPPPGYGQPWPRCISTR
jgi:hypothetical protein